LFGKRLYRKRNLIERFVSKLKHFRRVATRNYKLAANFLAWSCSLCWERAGALTSLCLTCSANHFSRISEAGAR
jgi:uncharacterized protein YigA (DUF484 family)